MSREQQTPDERGLVDWGLAEATALRLVRPGPRVSRAEADDAVASLRRLADEAVEHVERVTRLSPQGDPGPVAVVDRAGWVRANAASLRVVAGPVLERVAGRGRRPGRVALTAGRAVTGAQVGATLAFLAGKVLGQYEVFQPDTAGGRLLLVAPNVVETERALGVDPRDFRLWVCLHEQAHRAQFTGVPWLRDHLTGLVDELAGAVDLDPAHLVSRLRAALAGGDPDGPPREGRPALLELLQGPQQRAVLDRVQALMTLLEGHAEWAMDVVGPEVVPSVGAIRGAFDARRGGGGVVDRLLRRVLGLDLKAEQYRRGAVFVRAAVAAGGVAGFNTVWESPETLPTRAELGDPTAWLRRVLGSSAPLPA